MKPWKYALQRLYRDQPKDFVVDAVPALLGWLPKVTKIPDPPYSFAAVIVREPGGEEVHGRLELTWTFDALAKHDGDLRARVRRHESGRTVLREQTTEYAGYALAMVAVSLFLPGSRVVGINRYQAPDLLLDATPGALRGVEVAARARGGRGQLRSLRLGSPKEPGKASGLIARMDVAEAHLSLWCGSPAATEFVKVKP
jgi:hypothetical protein